MYQKFTNAALCYNTKKKHKNIFITKKITFAKCFMLKSEYYVKMRRNFKKMLT